MKTKSPFVKRATYLVDLDTEKRTVTLRVSRDTNDGESSSVQVYNLDILPLDMVMSQICGLLMPKQR